MCILVLLHSDIHHPPLSVPLWSSALACRLNQESLRLGVQLKAVAETLSSSFNRSLSFFFFFSRIQLGRRELIGLSAVHPPPLRLGREQGNGGRRGVPGGVQHIGICRRGNPGRGSFSSLNEWRTLLRALEGFGLPGWTGDSTTPVAPSTSDGPVGARCCSSARDDGALKRGGGTGGGDGWGRGVARNRGLDTISANSCVRLRSGTGRVCCELRCDGDEGSEPSGLFAKGAPDGRLSGSHRTPNWARSSRRRSLASDTISTAASCSVRARPPATQTQRRLRLSAASPSLSSTARFELSQADKCITAKVARASSATVQRPCAYSALARVAFSRDTLTRSTSSLWTPKLSLVWYWDSSSSMLFQPRRLQNTVTIPEGAATSSEGF
ncbi:hypothetical protein EYF80_010911 [Liparis tanakae]|uniref:Uncharacterized protein n=1 Tax=Liparis tanakae TaxID=230148 RepID=A0A4Z2ILS3_9TELE|nr:hypothetical protein EYF80_010911 [Liparis tanakae]